MKKIFTLLSLLIILVSHTSASEFTIKGKIKGVGGKIYLAKQVNDNFLKIDSTIIEDRKFFFRGSVSEHELYFLLFENNPDAHISFINENSDIKITADLSSNKATVIEGASQQVILNNFNDAMQIFNKRIQKMHQDYSMAKQGKNNKEMKSILKDYNAMQKEKLRAIKEFIKQHRSDYAAAVIVSKQSFGNTKDINEMLSLLDPKLLKKDILRKVKKD